MRYKKIIVILIIIWTSYISISNAKVVNEFLENLELSKDVSSEKDLDVDIEGELIGKEDFKPGEFIDYDKITLVNNEDFSVRFTLFVDEENLIDDRDLLSKLELDVVGANKVFGENKYEVPVDARSSQEVYSNVSWVKGEIDSNISESSAKYIYDIEAEENKVIYESYFKSEDDLEGWVNAKGILTVSSEGMILECIKSSNAYGELGKFYKEDYIQSNEFPEGGIEISCIFDLSKFTQGITGDGFNYYVTLNDYKGEYNMNFVYNVMFVSNKGIYVYIGQQVNDTPVSSDKRKLIQSDNNLFKFTIKLYNNSGKLESIFRISNEKGEELFTNKLTSLGLSNEIRWDIDNCGGVRKIGFSGVRAKEYIIVKSSEIKIYE